MWRARRKNDSEVSVFGNWLSGGVINQKTKYRQRRGVGGRENEFFVCGNLVQHVALYSLGV